MTKQLLLVFLGGGLGSVCRYLVGKLVSQHWISVYPYGTFAANLLGSLLIGLIVGVLQKQASPTLSWSLLFVTGFCGGFTTFSSFANENLLLLKEGLIVPFMLYTALSVVIGIACVGLGYWLAEDLFK